MEIISCSITYKKIVNRGFLFGPICPVYGVGSIGITLALCRYDSDPVIVFLVGMLLTSCLEYYTSYILEKIFHNRWWDYSNRKDSINGRICLKNCLLFGIASLIIIYLINPFFNNIISIMPNVFIYILTGILGALFILDIIGSSIIAYNLRNKIIIAEELKAEKLRILPGFIERKYKEKINDLKLSGNRLLKAFPYLFQTNEKELKIINKIKDKKKK